jgi:hypothetical protein
VKPFCLAATPAAVEPGSQQLKALLLSGGDGDGDGDGDGGGGGGLVFSHSVTPHHLDGLEDW